MAGLTGFLVVLCMLKYSDAAITAWTGTSPAGTMTIGGTAAAGTAAISLQSSLAVGATLFTVTAAAGDAIASYTFKVAGNPGTQGAIAKVGTAGVVTLAKALDYANTKEVVFIVVATDSATPTAGTAEFTVTVKFGPSTDTAYSFCVADPTASGAVIGSPSSSVSTAVWTVTGGIDQTKFTVVSGVIKTAGILQSTEKIYYTATLTLTDGAATSVWPLHVLADNSCLMKSGVVQVVSGLAMIVMTVLAIRVV